jgi:hypothetical protein
MKTISCFLVLTAVLLGLGNTRSSAAESVSVACVFNSPLRYSGTQWHIRSGNGPIYLARWEKGAWRVLAAFDGTKGNYFLDWERPASGVYVAVDSFGICSESFKIGVEQ